MILFIRYHCFRKTQDQKDIDFLMAQWRFLSYNGEAIKDPHEPFTLSCSPETDLWEKPPSVHSSNAPCLVQTITKGSFVSARVTVAATWVQKYDQGGLVMFMQDAPEDRKWVKTGIEFLNGQPQVSTVATYKWSDWSLRPMASQKSTSATIEMESNEDGSLWVYLIDEHGNRSPMREVTWWGDMDASTEVSVGVYAAKPDKDPKKLLVSFQALELNVKDQ